MQVQSYRRHTHIRNMPQVCGIYVAQGPSGVYIGASVDCYGRNEQLTRLGVAWGIVREMPGSTDKERRSAEGEVAEQWAARGWAVVSRNTHHHLSSAARNRPARTAESRAAVADKLRGRRYQQRADSKARGPRSPAWREAMRVGIQRAKAARATVSL
jgi:hypothetical protein